MHHHSRRCMEVISGKQFYRFLHTGCPVQQKPDCCGRCQIRFPRILRKGRPVLNHQHGDTQSLFIHSIHRCIRRRRRQNTHPHVFRKRFQPYVQKVHIDRGNRLIAVRRRSLHNHGVTKSPVKITAIQPSTRLTHRSYGTAPKAMSL